MIKGYIFVNYCKNSLLESHNCSLTRLDDDKICERYNKMYDEMCNI